MIAYWSLFLYPALLALAYPRNAVRYDHDQFQRNAMALFVLTYTLIGGLRYETGGDWITYNDLHYLIAAGSFYEAITIVDPLYGALNWVSSRIGGGIYLVNGFCCAVLGLGTTAVAKRFREPWMAIVIAVPYLLIVVGLGYVRQGAAIGFILLALASLDLRKPSRAIVFLALATGFHSTAVFVHPFFAYAIARRNRLNLVLMTMAGGLLYVYYVAPRLEMYRALYIETEYGSSGALIRVLMGAIPAIFVLLFRKRFVAEPQRRTTWLLIGLANLALLGGLAISPSSTAVDRAALYFSIIQLAAFGQFRDLAAVSGRSMVLVRLGLIVVAGCVQMVWLVLAVHSEYWVPYKSILQPTGI